MNSYGFIVLAALAVDFLLHTVADVLNLRALDKGVPETLRGLYSDDDYYRSKRYVRLATSVEVTERIVLLFAILAFWFLGGFGWVDAGLRVLAVSEVVRGLLYVGTLMLGQSVISLPFQIRRSCTSWTTIRFLRG